MLKLSVHEGVEVGPVIMSAQSVISEEMAKAVLKAATFAGGVLAENVVKEFPNGKGDLAGSFLPAKFVRTESGGIAAGALSDLPYAGILNRGGTIRPRTAKMLAIPLTQEAKVRWPRDWAADDLVLISSKKAGTALLIGAKEKELVVHYVLKDEVTINPTHYIDWAAEETKRKIPDIFGEDLRKRLNDQMRRAANG